MGWQFPSHGKTDRRSGETAARIGPGWALDGDAIRRQFTFGGFADAIAFVARLAFDAEAADHHPDIMINYKRVTLTFSTHSEGGLTDKDFAGARRSMARYQRARGAAAPAMNLTELKNTYTSREVAAMTGLTARQLQWWDARRLFAPAHRAEADRARRLHRAPLHAGRSARADGARGTAAPGSVRRRICAGCSTRCAISSASGCSTTIGGGGSADAADRRPRRLRADVDAAISSTCCAIRCSRCWCSPMVAPLARAHAQRAYRGSRSADAKAGTERRKRRVRR